MKQQETKLVEEAEEARQRQAQLVEATAQARLACLLLHTCLCTACALLVHCLYTACVLRVRCVCTACALLVHCMRTACALHTLFCAKAAQRGRRTNAAAPLPRPPFYVY